MDSRLFCILSKTHTMKAMFFTAVFIGITILASAQTYKKDTALKPPPPPPVPAKSKLKPPVIVKDNLAQPDKPVKNLSKRVPPPPPPIIVRDSANKD